MSLAKDGKDGREGPPGQSYRGGGGSSSGPSVDRAGTPVVDPTPNVKDLAESYSKRQDDLREKDKEISDIKHVHMKELAALRAEHNATVGTLREAHQDKVSNKEAARIDSIRQVDREEVAKTAVAANLAITTLAKQTSDLQQSLAKQVSDTAAAQETRNSAQYSEINKRISTLELNQSEGRGKTSVVDPQMDKLTMMVETMSRNQASGSGAHQATKDYTAWIFAAFGALLGLSGLVFALIKATAK